MHIRIPYEKLGDVKTFRFVSFILDKGMKSIYRQDFLRTTHPDFFNGTQHFVTIPDDIYEECDSVIFFPFSEKTNSWLSKTIMWKESDFETINGGFQYIRNAEAVSDMKKLNAWLDRGRKYNEESKIGLKNLIYFTVFCKQEYVQLFELLLTTLAKNPFNDFELLIMTDETTLKEIKKIDKLSKFTHHFHIVDTIADPVDASMQKLKIYDFKDINQYKNILFLDVDIIVIGDLEKMFGRKVNADVLYSSTHNRDQSLHKTVYHCLADYTPEQLENFKSKNIPAFNAGQFYFINSPTMKQHFTNIVNFTKEWDGRYFFEQSFLNYYFNLLDMADTTTFKSEFQFVSINENQTDKVFGQNAVFVHFMGNACNGIGKMSFMKRYYYKYL